MDVTRLMSRECYQVTTAPGTPIEDPYEAIFDASITQDGEINFAPLEGSENDGVALSRGKGHRRAYFDLTQTPVKMCWLIP